MDYNALRTQVIDLLQREGRVAYVSSSSSSSSMMTTWKPSKTT
jgi:hypothetical protein